ncbi:restriction endonuclease subunit S [uncultured Selenomonas sp.]|uniref:restriction endonuclease subunit S n=1 Tax=uncultured Selenomonas sp. TaxID=159275 RepID=UPI002585EAC0|nr:restriction endonuclease subunit S [uncultured Selenomonas sp.]
MTEKGKNTPTVRFKGFCDDWEQRKLGEIAEIIGGGTPSTNNPSYWDGDIDWYAPAEIGERIFANGSIRKITKEGLNHCSAKILPAYKTVLFTSRAGIGKMAILQHPATTNQGFQSLVCHNDIAPYFVFSMGKNIKAGAERVAAGSTFAEISGKTLSNLEFMFPNTAEQQAIGACFKNIDMLITLHQRQLDEQKALKKYFLQNMFPAKGEKVPRIRFQGFTGDWEQRKLGDVADSFEYGLNAAAKEFDGVNKYIRITDIDDSTHEFLPIDLTSPDTVIEQADNYKLDEGDILFARTGASVGKTYIYKQSDGLVYYAGFLIRARINKKYDPEFIFQNTLTPDYDKYIRITSQRSGQPGVNAQEYADYELMIPRIDEQKRIGEFLRNLDDLITLHQRQLTQLQAIKKFMLQNLFI